MGVPWLGATCGSATTALPAEKTSATMPASPAITWTAASPTTPWPTTASASRSPKGIPTCRLLRLLCAGLIGYRSLVMAGDVRRLGIYGFGAAAHIVTQLASWQGREVYAFTRPATWRGRHLPWKWGQSGLAQPTQASRKNLDAAIIFAPAGELVPIALRALRKGGTVVCGGIHMSDIPSFPYDLLWGERVLRSVANLTRRDGEEFLELAPRVPVRTEVQVFPLEEANQALAALREGHDRGGGGPVSDSVSLNAQNGSINYEGVVVRPDHKSPVRWSGH